MIRMPLPEVKEKIIKATSLDDSAIEEKIAAKLEQLSGLISKEGAAHIVANELGVKLFENSGKIKDLYTGQRNVMVSARVVSVYEEREFKRGDGTMGRVCSALIGDETAVTRLVGWGDQAGLVKALMSNDIVSVTSGYVRENNRGYKEVHLNDRSKIVVNPEGIKVGETKADSPPRSYERKTIAQLSENDMSVEILGTITNVFDVRFFEVCPLCNGRMKQAEEGWACQTHGNAEPQYSYVMNIFLDDGTEKIRIVLFRDLIEKLSKRSREQLLVYRESPEQFDDVKTELLGEQFVMQGRIKKNTFFDRIEFIPNTLEPADAQKELERLSKE